MWNKKNSIELIGMDFVGNVSYRYRTAVLDKTGSSIERTVIQIFDSNQMSFHSELWHNVV